MSNLPQIGFLGFGEAGEAFASGLRAAHPDLPMRSYDIKSDDAATAPEMTQRQCALGVAPVAGAAGLAGAQVIFSLVTADRAGEAATALARAELNGALVFDGNSCAPGSKRANAEAIEAAGGRYVDCAVMAPVHPHLHRAPCLLSGPHAEAALDAAALLGMDASHAPGPVGTASLRKMLRSVIMKGMEALTLECVLAAREAGVEADVLASLDVTFPGFDWEKKARYNLERVTSHGLRRAAEMAEVARTVEELGFPAEMSHAITAWQARVGALGLEPGSDDLGARADAILAALPRNGADAGDTGDST